MFVSGKIKGIFIKISLLILCILLLCANLQYVVIAENNLQDAVTEADIEKPAETLQTYRRYKKENGLTAFGDGDIVLSANDSSLKSSDVVLAPREDSDQPVLQIPENSFVEWRFHCDEAVLYNVEIEYCAGDEGSGNIRYELYINGRLPFREASLFALSRQWAEGVFSEDIQGNQMLGENIPVNHKTAQYVFDASSYEIQPLFFKFDKGENTIRMAINTGSIDIYQLKLTRASTPTYEEYVSAFVDTDASPEAETIELEAEKLSLKSDTTIYPSNEHVSAFTSPQDPRKSLLNVVGGDKWQTQGQWIQWSFDVEKDGLYTISFRYLQNYMSGKYVSRKLLLDGELPFQEASNLKFSYGSSWQTAAIGNDDQEFVFYLEQGRHSLTLEVVLGDMGDILGRLTDALSNLNAIYLDILMVTGKEPDPYRDYFFDSILPESLDNLKAQSVELQEIINLLSQKNGMESGEYTALLKKIQYQTGLMADKPSTIAKNFVDFKSNIGALGTWLYQASLQPLLLDRIYITPINRDLPKEERSFLKNVWFNLQCFWESFFMDYSSLPRAAGSQMEGEEIKVWIPLGRDQSQILRRLIDNDFTEKNHTLVNLELISAGTLLPSVLAGNGPDVALSNAMEDPINYALRNAVVDLSQFPDFDEVSERFFENALVPFTFQDQVFGLPDTMTFLMFFYRTDIFNRLDIVPPQTWDELIALIPVLARHNMDIGFPTGLNGYALSLYQNGTDIYRKNLRTNFDSDSGLSAFEKFCELFTTYAVPVNYDFPNRFRTGEMPCGVQDYTLYNQLTVFAPEIAGLWKFVPVPGIRRSDNTIDNVSVASGTSVMIMRNNKNLKGSWEFVKWYLSGDTQSAYGKELENVIGSAAKYATANREALSRMSWTVQERANILKQLESARAIPQIPGSYYISRTVDFAFLEAYQDNEDPSDAMLNQIKELNDELKRKQAEFGVN